MPYSEQDGCYWIPDFELFAAIPGGTKLGEWFGFVTDFHDADLVGIDLQDSTAKLTINGFRMTNKVDAEGFFVLDRHASVTLTLRGVTKVKVTSELPTTVLELGIRRVISDTESLLEIGFDDVMGAGGSFIAERLEVDFVPVIAPLGRKSS